MSHHLSFMYSMPGQSGVDIRSSQCQPTSWMLKIVAPERPASFIASRSRVIPDFVTFAPCQCHHAFAPHDCGGASKSCSNLSGDSATPFATSVPGAIIAMTAIIATGKVFFMS